MDINITYIDHSGFLVEWDTCYWLFDYYKGVIPPINKQKPMVVFVSHSHGDHFNPKVFDLFKNNPNTYYLISSDIKLNQRATDKYGITEELSRNIIVIKPDQESSYSWDGNEMRVNTLKSTDMGVAFLIRYMDKIIYYAGDLNLWVWKGESKQFNNNMKAKFLKEMSKLENINIDIAFAPLDPRLEDWFDLGMDALLDTTKVRYVFPMHFWDKPEIIVKYKKEKEAKYLSTYIMDIKEPNQSFNLDI